MQYIYYVWDSDKNSELAWGDQLVNSIFYSLLCCNFVAWSGMEYANLTVLTLSVLHVMVTGA